VGGRKLTVVHLHIFCASKNIKQQLSNYYEIISNIEQMKEQVSA